MKEVKQLTVRVPADLFWKLKAAAAVRGLPFGEFIITVLSTHEKVNGLMVFKKGKKQ